MEQYRSSRRLGLDERQSVNELLRLKPNNKQLKDHIHKKLVTLRKNMKAKVKEVTKDGRRDELFSLSFSFSFLYNNSCQCKGYIIAF